MRHTLPFDPIIAAPYNRSTLERNKVAMSQASHHAIASCLENQGWETLSAAGTYSESLIPCSQYPGTSGNLLAAYHVLCRVPPGLPHKQCKATSALQFITKGTGIDWTFKYSGSTTATPMSYTMVMPVVARLVTGSLVMISVVLQVEPAISILPSAVNHTKAIMHM